jgi:DGQHR domain-containing protein
MINKKGGKASEELRIDVVEVKQPIGTFYVGSVDAYDLLEICKFDFRRIDESGGFKEFLGFQRKLDLKRVRDIEQYIQTVDAVFPTAIVISVDDRCVAFEKGKSNALLLHGYVDAENSDFQIDYSDIASIIDEQHRLKAFENVQELDFKLSVAVFIGIDEATKAEIFSTVNLTQTKVNKSLVYDLFALRKARSPEKTCHEIVVALDSLKKSPFDGKIKRLGTATEGRFGETLSQATIVRDLLPYITNDALSDRDVGKRVGFWDPISSEQLNKRIFYEFFRRNEDNGFNGLIRFLRPAYLNFTTEPKVISKDRFSSLFQKVKLSDEDFNTDNFAPGGSGSTKLYRTLLEQTRIQS